ncbi:glycosyltransferase [Prochlorococcus sp. MIT 0801]|uniref:glycosyltransferase family 2 protein n=1 Tax=Prochlorococcus sp. MIT 0801 TaxID=1501269 RepID=UPI0004F887E4|nr:glycosyltransferase [Prochlorococcus sp. MIT 0801]AIQ97820.1 hypothetical protein EW15_1728 [Prochlorococcus sp. MIT 0801]
MSVFHSLVIPTRNRQDFVVDAVTYYLKYIEDLGEIIIADNSDNKRSIFQALKLFLFDSRLKILPSQNSTLSMKDNWERGVAETKGEWVSIIGDDDIISPDLIFFLRNFLAKFPDSLEYEAFSWRAISFSWMGVDINGRRNPSCIPIDGSKITGLISQNYLENILSWTKPKRTMGCGPSIYHGLWKRSLINKVKDLNNGLLFDAQTVDFDAGYNALLCTEKFVVLERPFSILGSCPKSNSAAGIDYLKKTKAMENWYKEAGSLEGGPKDIYVPNSITLCIYFFNKYWMEKQNYSTKVDISNVLKGLASELESIDPKYFELFRDELINFIKKTELVDYLDEFKPVKRQREEIAWNGYVKGSMLIDPTPFADRILQFADVAFAMLIPWQLVGTNFKVQTDHRVLLN